MENLLNIARISSSVSPIKEVGEYVQHNRPSPYMDTTDIYGDYQNNDIVHYSNCKLQYTVDKNKETEYAKSEVSYYGDRLNTTEYGSQVEGKVQIVVLDPSKPASFMWDDGSEITYNPITGWK